MIEEISTAIDRENLLKGKTVVITGAGSGIGKEIARSFSNKGPDLILSVSYTHLTLPTIYSV